MHTQMFGVIHGILAPICGKHTRHKASERGRAATKTCLLMDAPPIRLAIEIFYRLAWRSNTKTGIILRAQSGKKSTEKI